MPSVVGNLVEQGRQFVNRTLACRKVSVQLSRPIVSFTFDDFPRSAYLVGGRILNQFGLKGTYYTAMSLMNACNQQGEHFRAEDLENVAKDGHELGCHTFQHFSCSTHSPQQCLESVRLNQQQLNDVLPGYKLHHFSFPFGHVVPAVKKSLGSHFSTCRSIYCGLNRGQIDLNLLLANRLYEKIPIANIERVIQDNREDPGWLILYTHDVQEHPSPYGCTPQYFEHVLNLALKSEAEILTVSEAVSRFQI
jgi:peptidoglycan/xylan/chitin deacetylase (PgdA/CDA1 family)